MFTFLRWYIHLSNAIEPNLINKRCFNSKTRKDSISIMHLFIYIDKPRLCAETVLCLSTYIFLADHVLYTYIIGSINC